MNKNLEQAVETILRHEGGYVNDPQDPGGCTNYGITIATYRSHIDPDADCDDVRTMDRQDAIDIYADIYWHSVRADDLPPGVDLSVFDMAVNAGPRRAAILLQGVVGAARDGKIGPRTLAKTWDIDGERVIRDYERARVSFYRRLKTWRRFGRGWTRRARETREESLRLHNEQRPEMEVVDDAER